MTHAALHPSAMQTVAQKLGDEMKPAEHVVSDLVRQGLPFAVGGGIAYGLYSGCWRNTGDLDLFVRPHDRQAFIEVLAAHGFMDYFDRKGYDRGWIYRSHKGELIIDVIWQMANYRAAVDDDWLTRGATFSAFGQALRAIPIEELMMAKLYIIQRERCDWPDVLGLLYQHGPTMDWEHLLERIAEDRALLAGLVSVFSWLCPPRAAEFPESLWDRLGLRPPEPGPDCRLHHRRVDLLDSRAWFAPLMMSQGKPCAEETAAQAKPPQE